MLSFDIYFNYIDELKSLHLAFNMVKYVISGSQDGKICNNWVLGW